MATPVPRPPGLPLIGNVFDLDSDNQLKSMSHLAEIYGAILSISETSW